MEGLGDRFKKARSARGLTIEEAARMTKIRPAKIAEIEAEDFSQFPSLAYAKGFVQIYGKFLSVDVTAYLEAFETSEHMTVDGYSYLQDNPAPAPRRTEVVPKRSAGNKSSLLPLVIGIVVLIAGFSLLKLMMDVRRLKPSNPGRDAQALAASSPIAAAAPLVSAGMVAPRALPVDNAPAPAGAAAAPIAQASIAPAVTAAPTAIAAETPGGEGEPEIRRAEPVHAEDLENARAAIPMSSPTPAVNRYEVRPLKKTYVRVVVDQAGQPALERWINVAEGPVQFRGSRIAIKVLDPTAVEIRKNGKVISRTDADVRVE
ncbi:MAG: helix-turn-helix domain-containing protein [Verrucomicrobiota bacterium]|nr:helix-turn-helix domain-containing protein [Verrucomicrobiota bacterium]